MSLPFSEPHVLLLYSKDIDIPESLPFSLPHLNPSLQPQVSVFLVPIIHSAEF